MGPIEYFEYATFDAFRSEYGRFDRSHRRWLACEGEINAHGSLPGWCTTCDRAVAFAFEPRAGATPNWRESLRCSHCGIINRNRAALYWLTTRGRPSPEAVIYLTEERSATYRWLKGWRRNTIGSEFLPDRLGEAHAARHEDLRALSFDDRSIDHVLSFDCLEHIADYRRAIAEIWRVLKPGGLFVFTVPFSPHRADTVVRAVVAADGTVEHLLEPEYHGDPLRPDGVLAFYDFGWDLLDSLRAVGFDEVRYRFIWSDHHGFLGATQTFVAARP